MRPTPSCERTSSRSPHFVTREDVANTLSLLALRYLFFSVLIPKRRWLHFYANLLLYAPRDKWFSIVLHFSAIALAMCIILLSFVLRKWFYFYPSMWNITKNGQFSVTFYIFFSFLVQLLRPIRTFIAVHKYVSADKLNNDEEGSIIRNVSPLWITASYL